MHGIVPGKKQNTQCKDLDHSKNAWMLDNYVFNQTDIHDNIIALCGAFS